MKTQVLEIQTGRTGLQKRIEAVQGDSGRTLKCIITDMTIPAGAVARIYAVKPSGSEVYNDCTISENTVEIELTTQLLAETDITRCQVQISYIGKTVTSFEFAIDVKRSLISGSAIESTDEFTALEAALQQAQGLNAPVFTEAATREDIQSGDTLSTLFGKIKKWFTDLGTAAFCTVINNLTATQAGGVLDARQGAVINTTISNLSQSFDQLNSKIGIKILYYEISASGPAYANKSLYDNVVALRAAYAPNEPVIIYMYSGALSDVYNQSLPVVGVPNIVTVKCPPDPARAAITFEGIGADTVRYCKIMGGTISNWHA